MHLLLILLVAALALIVPSMSYSDTTQYEMKATGFGIKDIDIEKVLFQIDLNQDKLTGQKGQIIIDDKTQSIKTLTMSTSMGGKSIKIDGVTDDNSSIALTGRLVTQMKDGTVYETRGNISNSNAIEKTMLIITIRQKPSITVQPPTPTPIKSEPTKNLTLEVNQNMRNYWNENYKISVKVFDTALNKKPKFDDFFGTLNNVLVNVTISHSDGKSNYRLNGLTKDNGYWQGTQYFPENISKPGKYNVLVVAKQGDSMTSKNLEMFLFGVVANRITVTNGTTP